MSAATYIKRLVGLLGVFAGFTFSMAGMPCAAEHIPAVQEQTGTRIAINLASRILTLYENGQKAAIYPVGVGTRRTPTPTGRFVIQNKAVNPTWVNPQNTQMRIGPGPNNPVGKRWMGFYGSYGIHGTNHPESVGKYVSHGCVRMKGNDIEGLFSRVTVGTPVMIYYDRIVIDRASDHTISYYIYPDGYERQPLTAAQVQKVLRGYGVEDFETPAAIAAKIKRADGKPTYVAKAYSLYIGSQKLTKRALGKQGHIYIPVFSVAQQLRVAAQWNDKQRQIETSYGTAPGIIKNDSVYADSRYMKVLFHMQGNLTSRKQYVLQVIKTPSDTHSMPATTPASRE